MPRLDAAFFADLDTRLAPVDAALARTYPGEPGTRQPVHTVYIPADRFAADSARQWGDTALALVDARLPDLAAWAQVTGLSPALTAQVVPLVVTKLRQEPIEDLRIDLEDGYGTHPDDAEDRVAVAAARALGDAVTTGTAPPFVGIRFKSLEPGTRRRGLRTLDLFLENLLTVSGALPDGFVITLPKVTHVGQVEAFVTTCAALEAAHGIATGTLRFEIQIETPQSVQDADGRATVAAMIPAGSGRVSGLHYGTYDYSAACGVTAANQSLAHPVADHAKAVMQLAAAGTGVRVSDGSTNVVPTGDDHQIRAAWQLHAGLVRRALERAYYQGWDMHPGHLVTRFAVTYGFFRSEFPAAAARLAAYLGQVDSGVLDEPATAQAMASLLIRGQQSGALSVEEITAATGAEFSDITALYRRRVG
jgi:citrate lyase beta subunit